MTDVRTQIPDGDHGRGPHQPTLRDLAPRCWPDQPQTGKSMLHVPPGASRGHQGKELKAPKVLELSRLLPLKPVKISVLDPLKPQLPLKLPAGHSCYLQGTQEDFLPVGKNSFIS